MIVGRVEAQFGGVYRRCSCDKQGVPPARCPHPWYYRVRHKGREIRRSVGPGPKCEKVAWDKLREFQVRLVREGTLGIRSVGKITLAGFRARIDAEFRGRYTDASWATFGERYGTASTFFTEHLDTITESRVREFLRWLGQRRLGKDGNPRPVTAATRNRYLDVLSVTFAYAVSEGFALENPIPAIPRTKEPKVRPPQVSRADLDAILARAIPDLRPFANLIYETALRRNEALNLQWVDVDLGRRMLNIRRGKTASSVRPAALNAPALAVLEELARARVAPLRGEDPVFPALHGNPGRVTRAFSDAARAANLPKVTLHKLRASVATRLLEQGIGVTVVRDLMGHSSIAVTDRYSSGAPSQAMQEAVDRLAPPAPAVAPLRRQA
jgi:integrase